MIAVGLHGPPYWLWAPERFTPAPPSCVCVPECMSDYTSTVVSHCWSSSWTPLTVIHCHCYWVRPHQQTSKQVLSCFHVVFQPSLQLSSLHLHLIWNDSRSKPWPTLWQQITSTSRHIQPTISPFQNRPETFSESQKFHLSNLSYLMSFNEGISQKARNITLIVILKAAVNYLQL